jgi:hypothetical protein
MLQLEVREIASPTPSTCRHKGTSAPGAHDDSPRSTHAKSHVPSDRTGGIRAKLTFVAARSLQSMRRVSSAQHIEQAGDHILARFNGAISPNRVVTAARLPFDEFKQLRYAVPGAPINDLAICVIAGALRSYIADKGEPTDQALVVQVPVNIRTHADQAQQGNKISAIEVSTCSDIADPLECLRAINHSAESGKRRLAMYPMPKQRKHWTQLRGNMLQSPSASNPGKKLQRRWRWAKSRAN